MSVGNILLIVAMICFLLAACNLSGPINLVALGLFFISLSAVVGGVPIRL